jgi:hypothetical protein
MPAADDADFWMDVLLRVATANEKEGPGEWIPPLRKAEDFLKTIKNAAEDVKSEKEKQLNGCLGPAPSLELVKNLVDTILTVSTHSADWFYCNHVLQLWIQ